MPDLTPTETAAIVDQALGLHGGHAPIDAPVMPAWAADMQNSTLDMVDRVMGHLPQDVRDREKARIRAQFEVTHRAWGIEPPREPTPQEIAQQRHDAHWQSATAEAGPWSAGHTELVESEIDREDALSPAERAAHVAELKRDFGEETYSRLLAEAKSVVEPGQWRESMGSNRFALRNLASLAAYYRAYERSASRLPR